MSTNRLAITRCALAFPLLLAAGCGDQALPGGAIPCTTWVECPPDRPVCENGACTTASMLDLANTMPRRDLSAAVDMAPMRPPDLASSTPDLTVDAGCGPGLKLCGGRCIPVMGCCVNADCVVTGQVCQNDNNCACAQGLKVCANACVPL